MNPKVTINDVKAMTEPTKDFLCTPEDNVYDVEFVYFKIRNPDTNTNLF